MADRFAAGDACPSPTRAPEGGALRLRYAVGVARPRFWVIRGGGRGGGVRVGAIDVAVAPEESPPFPVAAIVIEEDTYLVLSAAAEQPMRPEHPLRLMTALRELEPEPPGSLVVREGQPLRFLAIVHDLNRDPTWTDEWVESAYERALAETGRRGLRALGLELLATRHGRMEPQRSLDLLRDALERATPPLLERLWISAPAARRDAILARLAAAP